MDVTQENDLEQRYRLIAEAMPQFVWLDDAQGRTTYANTRWLEYSGLTQEASAGSGWEEAVHPEDLRRLRLERARATAITSPFEIECRYRGADGKFRWFLLRCVPLTAKSGEVSGWLGVATDIDKQKRAEAQQAFFALASDVLGSTLDVATTLERIARLAVAAMGTWCQIDLPDSRGRLRVAVIAHQQPEKEALLGRLVGEYVYNEKAEIGPPAAASKLKPQLLGKIDEDAVRYVIPDARHRQVYREVGYAGGLIVPLRIRDRVLGILGIASDDASRLYTEFDVATALELGRRGAIALENAQSFQREHRVSTTLQRALLPAKLPAAPGVRFYSAYTSVASPRGEAVGGDWYDAFPLDERYVAMSIGDVAGHGIDAAVTMSVVRQAIRAAALEGHVPKDILVRANAMLMLEPRAPMITAVVGIFDTQTRNFVYAVAGHPRPLLVDERGNVQELAGAGAPLGDVFSATSLEQHTIAAQPGSSLIFYTDGLIEFGRNVLAALERLNRAVRDPSFLNAADPAQAVIDLTLDADQTDDVAVLVMRVR